MVREHLLTLVLPSVLAALIGYFISARLLYWNVPRRHNFWPSLVVSLAGTSIFAWAAIRILSLEPTAVTVFISGLPGAFLALFAAVKIGTPAHASVVVVLDDPIEVTPRHFFVSQQGSVSWFFYGPHETEVGVTFSEKYDPFSEEGKGWEYRDTIPDTGLAIVSAGPVRRAGRGSYQITGGGRTVTVNGGESPRRRG
jgi:hypothetical protein